MAGLKKALEAIKNIKIKARLPVRRKKFNEVFNKKAELEERVLQLEDIVGGMQRIREEREQTLAKLKKDLASNTKVNEELRRELLSAREMEESILAKGFTKIEGVDSHVWFSRANLLRGDLSTVSKTGNNYVVGIADVMGKGIAAALVKCRLSGFLHGGKEAYEGLSRDATDLLMDKTKIGRGTGKLKYLLSPKHLLEGIVQSANRHLHRRGRKRTNLTTMIHGVFNPKKKTFYYVNAGHDPLLVVRAKTGRVQEISGPNIALGVNPEFEYKLSRVRFKPGDILVMYSDGLTEHSRRRRLTVEEIKERLARFEGSDEETEAERKRLQNRLVREHFGIERVKAILRDSRKLPAKKISERIRDAMMAHNDYKKPQDDVTLMILKILP
ncbi:serine/threonine-protein phosphatase [Candidatus Micrarchaeota archaeon]|nr:serine/threonine-protein phosphatase [Candidatus Micrarchaeota archaeon]